MKYLEQFFKNVNYYQYIQGLKSKKSLNCIHWPLFKCSIKVKLSIIFSVFMAFFKFNLLSRKFWRVLWEKNFGNISTIVECFLEFLTSWPWHLENITLNAHIEMIRTLTPSNDFHFKKLSLLLRAKRAKRVMRLKLFKCPK